MGSFPGSQFSTDGDDGDSFEEASASHIHHPPAFGRLKVSITLSQNHESGREFQMFDRSFSWTLRHSVQATHLPFLGILILLALAVSGMEARAGDDQSISTFSASSVALIQVARSPSSVTQHEEAGDVLGLAQDDVASWWDGSQPISQSLDLDISLEQIGGLYETVDDNERNSARVSRIASCYEASVGRYHSEERGAFTNTLSESARFDAAMTHFTALRDSRLQFDSCSRS